MTQELPTAAGVRWQPLRAGLVDVFYYDQEEFWFRDGRLLLRGNNGTGKSKVLALMLPFLFDGELAAYRVEPDGDPKKRMDWNLLLGGGHPHAERLGYTWIEFGRRDEDGVAHYVTLGCGMKAVTGRGMAGHWFFVTSRRVRGDLALADAAGIALTRDRLEEALGNDGVVHRTAAAYRRAVDEALFGLGELRYNALLNLLLSIRAPQLSKRPSERALSDALTEALPPLDQALLADVAEAFRGLEEDRLALEAMVEARDAASDYLRTYREYTRIACRRRAAPMRQAQTTYDRVSRDRAAAEAAYAAAVTALAVAGERVTAARDEAGVLHARDRALRESPEARSASALEGAEREASASASAAADGEVQRIAAVERASTLSTRLAQAKVDGEAAVAALAAARRRSRQAAAQARLEETYARRIEDAIEATAVTELQRRATELTTRQEEAIKHVRVLLDAVVAREHGAARASDQLDAAVSDQDALAVRVTDIKAALENAAGDLVQAARHWLEAASVLAVPNVEDVVAALELWVETLDGPSPLRVAVDAADRAGTTRLAEAGAALAARRAELAVELEELRATIVLAEAGEDVVPPVTHTRAVDVRQTRVGAPFWTLVDFRDVLSATDRAGLEAALEASGLLDAWVSSDGSVQDAAAQDTIIDVARAVPVSGTRLAEALVPAAEVPDPWVDSVPTAVVQQVLDVIGLGDDDAPVWVGVDGRFRSSVLRGAWRKDTAVYIGRGAREAARRRRVVALRRQETSLVDELAGVDRAAADVDRDRNRLEAERGDMPDDMSLRDTHRDVVAAQAEQARLQGRVEEARERAAVAVAALEAGRVLADDGAAELLLPADSDGLDAVAHGIAVLREALAALWPAIADGQRTAVAATQAADECAAADAELVKRTTRADELKTNAAALAERYNVLQATVGQAVAELQAQLTRVTEALRTNRRAQEAAEQQHASANRDVGHSKGQIEGLSTALEEATAGRREAALGLQRFAEVGLIAVAAPEVAVPIDDEWGVTTALRLARQLDHELADVDDEQAVLDRAQRRATDELNVLSDALRRHGNTASAQLQEAGITVEVVFRGRGTTVPAVVDALVEEVADRRRLLDEQEREVLENHLISEVASTLQELISAAEAQVLEMNGELVQRPTSTGMRLRLQWRVVPDGPAGLAVARERLLRQTADAWSLEDRAAVGAFLQAQIQQVRAQNTAGTWLEHLTEALDYRTWHHFAIQRHRGGEWRSATGPASGGERVLVASVPLFAAASSHYASATNPHAPRLVMLDEAFAGVDDDSRAKCLGLLAAFDLDVVMTSEREWGCYSEVPGLAIAQLARVEGVPAVLVTRWEWDGTKRVAVNNPQAGTPRVSVAEPTIDAPPGLWTAPPTHG